MKSMLLAVDFAPIIAPVLEVLNALLWPCIAIVGAVGTIYCIFLGIKIAKSDEQNSREKAKKDLIGAIVGFLTIFILMVALKIAIRKREIKAVLQCSAKKAADVFDSVLLWMKQKNCRILDYNVIPTKLFMTYCQIEIEDFIKSADIELQLNRKAQK